MKDAGDGSPHELPVNGKVKAELNSEVKGDRSLAEILSVNSVESDGAGKDSELVGMPTCTLV